MRRIVLFFLLTGVIFTPAFTQEKPSKIKVLSTIKPVQSIVSAIAGDLVDSHQLIPDYASPHNYTFKPSDIRKIIKADLVFRIDEHFEMMLNPAFDNLADQSRLISLAENPGINLLTTTGGHNHGDKHEGAGGEHDNIDMHIFTSPDNAIVMAQQITKHLSKADPENASSYQKRLQKFSQRVHQKIDQIKAELKPFKAKPYIVFHNSWQYFATYFGLQKSHIVDLHEGVSAGAKTIKGIRSKITSEGISCVFNGPNISKARINSLTKSLNVKSVEIDVLAQQFPAGEDTYINWLNYMGQQVKACLGD